MKVRAKIAILRDDELAILVSQLRDIAKDYGHTQQLRERIAGILMPNFKHFNIDIDE